jgi:hypothetical protein
VDVSITGTGNSLGRTDEAGKPDREEGKPALYCKAMSVWRMSRLSCP